MPSGAALFLAIVCAGQTDTVSVYKHHFLTKSARPFQTVSCLQQTSFRLWSKCAEGVFGYPFRVRGAELMIVNEYRRRAAECLCIADEISGPQNKMLLIAIAQAWLKLAQKIEEADPASPSGKPATPPLDPK